MGINRNNKIQILYSTSEGVQPDVTELEPGELAINTVDGIMYFNKGGDTGSFDSNAINVVNTSSGVLDTSNKVMGLSAGTDISITSSGQTATISYTGTSVKTYVWERIAGEPSGDPGSGKFSLKEFPGIGVFLTHISETDLNGSDASSFLANIPTDDVVNITFTNVETGETSFIRDAYFLSSDGDQGSYWFFDNYGNVAASPPMESVFSTGSKMTLSWSEAATEPINARYEFTEGNPASNGDFSVTRIVGQGITQSTEIKIHKTDINGKDNRTANLGLSDLMSNYSAIIANVYGNVKGFTAGQVRFNTNGTGSYNGTYYTLGLSSVEVEEGTDGLTAGNLVSFGLAYSYARSGSDETGYVESFNGATGAVEGVSSINGLTGGITFNQGDNIILTTGDGGITIDAAVLTGVTGATGATGPQGEQGIQGVTGVTGPGVGYTSGADTPSSANTGDFWLETDTGDLFFYDGSAFVQISGADGVTGATGPQGDQGIQGVTGATGVDGVTGATGPVGDYVESFNGTTGAVEGVSSVNGQTGDVITPNEIVMRFPLWSVLGGLTGSYTARAHKVTQDLQLKTAEIYVPSGLAAGSGENFSISFKKTNTLSDSVANIDSGATTLNLGGIPSNTIGVTPPKSGSNYFSTKTVPDGTTCGDGDYIYVSIVTNTADPFDVEAYLVWEPI